MALWMTWAAAGGAPAAGGGPGGAAVRDPALLAQADLYVALGAEAGPAPRLVLLGGSTLDVHIRAAPGATVLWEFGGGGIAMRRGRTGTDQAGDGRLRLVVPDVRHRTLCEVLVAVEGAAEWRTLVLYPASLLKGAAGRLRERRIGVLDSRGTVQRALRAEGLAYEDLGPQVARDWFDGDLAILAGGPDRDTLAEACRAFDARVRGGMGMVILNPGAGWSAWGLRRVESAPPAAGPAPSGGGPPLPAGAPAARGGRPVRVWPEARAGLMAEDFGAGPWMAVLDGPADAVPLVWCESADGGPAATRRVPAAGPAGEAGRGTPSAVMASAGAGLPGRACAALVAARPVGAGWVLVSALPQTEFPDVHAVGRGVLAEMVLWLLQPPAAAQAKEDAHE